MPSYVITGASRGLGAEWLRQLSSDPSNQVFGIMRSISKSTVASYAESKPNVHLFESDVMDGEKLLEAAKKIGEIANGGAVDVLISNAAVMGSGQPSGAFANDLKGLEDEMNLCYQTDVIGTIKVFLALLPLLKKSSNPKAVFISTGFADAKFNIKGKIPLSFAYGTTKAALNFAVVKLAIEYPEIISLALSPGFVWSKDYEFKDAPEEEKGIYDYLLGVFRKVEPKGELIYPKESISLMKGIVDNLKKEDSGNFISHRGNDQIWL